MGSTATSTATATATEVDQSVKIFRRFEGRRIVTIAWKRMPDNNTIAFGYSIFKKESPFEIAMRTPDIYDVWCNYNTQDSRDRIEQLMKCTNPLSLTYQHYYAYNRIANIMKKDRFNKKMHRGTAIGRLEKHPFIVNIDDLNLEKALNMWFNKATYRMTPEQLVEFSQTSTIRANKSRIIMENAIRHYIASGHAKLATSKTTSSLDSE